MRVLLAGGGSGGSAAPVIAVGEALRRGWPKAEFLYVGTKSGPERFLVEDAGFPFVAIGAGRFRRYVTWRQAAEPVLAIAGLAQAGALVRAFRPDLAFGAGGFGTVAPLLVAAAARVPIAVHQQDVIPGLANRILAPFAALLTVALPETARAFRRAATVVGNPVRRAILDGDSARARAGFRLDSEGPVVLVSGGGTGAARVNQVAFEAARELVADCSLVHLTGAGKRVEGWSHARYHQREFLTREMADVLAVADVVVSRAGMSTLAEIGALRKAAILVPMPGSHQEANAASFGRRRAAVVLRQSALNSATLVSEVRALLGDPDRRRTLGEATETVLPLGADDRLATALTQLSARAKPARGQLAVHPDPPEADPREPHPPSTGSG